MVRRLLQLNSTQINCFDSSMGSTILGNPGATSRDDAIFSGERYFRAKVYFESWRAPGNLFLPNQFQKCSNSAPLIGQKNIFLPNQRSGIRTLLELVR